MNQINKVNKTIPKDKSNTIYFDDTNKDLISTKTLLVFYKLTPDEISFKRAQYVHSRKMWIDWEGYKVTDVLGWMDLDNIIKNI